MNKKVVIRITPEVRELISLLRPDANVESYGDGGNSLVSLPNHSPERILGYDCYEMANEWGVTPDEAAMRMAKEGWRFQDYDAVYGTELYQKP